MSDQETYYYKVEDIVPYTEDDYAGDFNLLSNEKEFIRKALLMELGNIQRASKRISTMSDRTFRNAVYFHSLREYAQGLKDAKKRIKSVGRSLSDFK